MLSQLARATEASLPTSAAGYTEVSLPTSAAGYTGMGGGFFTFVSTVLTPKPQVQGFRETRLPFKAYFISFKNFL